ncbi:HTH-type transcriptional regulator Ptr1 [uncultured archaeon]|nr:HTH-type transcriptional regulator Ptr1 [uncultured archaeon]
MMDSIDRKIIYELDLNARISTAKLARKMHVSREKVNYRINNLLEKGVIRKFVTMINPAKLGYSIYKMFFKFQNLNKKKEEEMINYLMKSDYVYWIANAQGRWDLNITVFAKDINHFDSILSEFISKYGKFILEQEFNTTLQVEILSKNWVLLDNVTERKIAIFGGETSDLKIDKIDVEILRVLANNARMNAVDIALKTKTTERQVIYRMRQLEKIGVILGYTTSLNLDLLDMQFFKATINLNNLNLEERNKVMNYCKSNPNIGFLIFCVGSWPLELEMIVRDNKQFYDLMADFREKFPEVKGYDTIIFPTEYKFDWMPLCYKAE